MESINGIQLIFITIAILFFALLVKVIYKLIKCFHSFKLLYYLHHDNYDINKLLIYFSNHCNDTGIYFFDAFILQIAFVFNPEHAKCLLNEPDIIDRPLIIMKGLKSLTDESLLMRNGKKWKESKQLLYPLFCKNNLEKFIAKMEYFSRHFLKNLNEKGNYDDINIELLIKRFTFTANLRTIVGVNRITVLEKKLLENFKPMDKLLHMTTGIFMKRIFNIFLWNDIIFSLSTTGRKLRDIKLFYTEEIKKVCFNFLQDAKNNKNFENERECQALTSLDIFYPYLINNKIPLTNIIDELIMLIVGGYQPSAMALCWCLYELGRNKKIQSRVQEEMDFVFNNGFQCSISNKHLKKLIYLECVIKETLRLYPVIPYTARISTEQLKFGDIKYPERTSFFIPIFYLHRNPIYFPNPDVFDPDRFLPENSSNINSSAYIPFSAGKRNCIGHYFAMMKIKIFLSIFLRQFTVDTLEDVTPKLGGLHLASNKPFKLNIRNRS